MACLRAVVVVCGLWCLAASAACGGCGGFDVCAPVDEAALAALPERLSETGFFAARDDGTLWPFTPQFELWSDGAAKRRFIKLPADGVIDTSDMDAWQLPVGAQLWKEFVVDGALVETRYLERTGGGAGDWIAAAYVWDGDDALLSIEGDSDVNGTAHEVPAAAACVACHDGGRGFALGFQAVQLSPQPGFVARDGDVDINALAGLGLLSAPPPAPLVVPGSDVQRRALGYLHANCSHCHNVEREVPEGVERCYDPRAPFDLTLRHDELDSVESTAMVRTARDDGQAFGERGSALDLMGNRTPASFLPAQMPPLATEVVDDDGVALLRAFLDTL